MIGVAMNIYVVIISVSYDWRRNAIFVEFLASQRFFIHSCICIRILIISYLATFLGTNCLYVLMCRKAVNQSITSGHLVGPIWKIVMHNGH